MSKNEKLILYNNSAKLHFLTSGLVKKECGIYFASPVKSSPAIFCSPEKNFDIDSISRYIKIASTVIICEFQNLCESEINKILNHRVMKFY